jgi:hypothetical protein
VHVATGSYAASFATIGVLSLWRGAVFLSKGSAIR